MSPGAVRVAKSRVLKARARAGRAVNPVKPRRRYVPRLPVESGVARRLVSGLHDLTRRADSSRARDRRGAVWRWSRRNKAVATLLARVGLLLVALTAGSLGTAAYFREQEIQQRALVQFLAQAATGRVDAPATGSFPGVQSSWQPLVHGILGQPGASVRDPRPDHAGVARPAAPVQPAERIAGDGHTIHARLEPS